MSEVSVVKRPLIEESTEAPSFNAKRVLLTGLKVLVSAGLIYYLLRQTDLTQIWLSMRSAHIPLLLLAFSLHTVGYFASSYRWKILLRAQNMDLPVMYLVESYAVAMFFNNVLPSTVGGDAVRAYDLWRKGYGKLQAVTSVVVERFLGLFTLMIFAALAIFFTPEVQTRIPGLQLWIGGGFFAMLLATAAIFMSPGTAKRIGRLFDLPALKIVKTRINKFGNAFKEFQGKTQALAISMVLSVVLQVNVVVHYWLLSEALGLEIPLTKYFLIIPLATFVTMVPVSINAIGLRENVYVFFLTAWGASVAACVAFAWIAYGMVLFLGIFGGVIYALRKPAERMTNKERVMNSNRKNTRNEILDTQKELIDERKSKLDKYRALFIGEQGFWKLVRYELIVTFCSWIPGALGLFLRSKLYPKILGKVGRQVAFGVNVTLRHPHKIRIGDNVVIDDNSTLDAKGDGNQGIIIGNGVFIGKNTILTCHDGDIILEDNVNIGFNCVISSLSSIVVKKNHLMASFCYLVGGNHVADRTDIPVLYQGRTSKGIIIDENVWLGAGVAVLDGSYIGRDCIVGAGAVVNGPIPEFSVAVGVPARVLRDRRGSRASATTEETERVEG